MTLEHYLLKDFQKERNELGLPKITDEEAIALLEKCDSEMAEIEHNNTVEYLDDLYSSEKQITDTIPKSNYSLLQKIKSYFPKF